MLSASKSGSGLSTGYNLTRSLRFRASASASLSRTNTSTVTNNAVWTWSAWVKIGYWSTGNAIVLFGNGNGGTNECTIKFVNNQLNVINYVSSTVQARKITTAVYRDPSAWYHFVVSSNSSTALNIYVNGVQVTAFDTNVAPSSAAWALNTASTATNIGFATALNYFDGEMTEVNFIDGQALTPSSFGSTNTLTGVWQSARYAGTYGTNGFYLPFTDNSALTTSSNVGLGKDFSGNGNYWTTNNISLTSGVTYDSMTDVPTLTSATAANFAVLNPLNPSRSTLTNGNLTASGTTDTPTIIPTSGTYYFEIDGVSKTWTPPATFPAAAGNYNFGQRPFTNTPTATLLNCYNLPTSTILQGNKVMDATLYTGNLIGQSITNAASFKPDLVWVKSRSAATDHKLTDSVRGATLALVSDSTAAETIDLTGVVSFNSNGFTLGTSTTYNNSGNTYVGWQWQAGQGTTSSNTNGTITSTVSVNASAGFSIVTYTGNGTNGATVGHGLGVKPSLIIEKGRASTYNWPVQGCGVLWPTATQTLFLNSTSTLNAGSGVAAPTSSVFTPAATAYANESGLSYVAYLWAPIAGYSAFGTYVGNGSSDGPFIYLGFRPKFVMFQCTTSGSNWTITDSVINPYNLSDQHLQPNSSAAQVGSSYGAYDLLSNGIKCRNVAINEANVSGATYIYAAFAENPFKNALAR